MNELNLLARNAFRKSGELKSFAEQLHDFADGNMPSGDMFIVAESSRTAGIRECVDLPIVMKRSTVQKIELTHDFPLTELECMPAWLNEYPLALESLADIESLLIIADAKDVHGNDILIALHLEKERRQIQLNEIASVYGKKNLAYLIENTFLSGKRIYVNERTGKWLQHAGLPLPERVSTYLSGLIVSSSNS